MLIEYNYNVTQYYALDLKQKQDIRLLDTRTDSLKSIYNFYMSQIHIRQKSRNMKILFENYYSKFYEHILWKYMISTR